MKRVNPVTSLSAIALTVLLFAGLAISLWINRGMAFSPGPLTAISKSGILIQGFSSHSQFEKQCKLCHEPLKTDLATKCLVCHQEISQQIKELTGVHSKISTVDQCVTCHPEHRGKSFDPTKAAYALFDHSRTRFNLNWHQENYDATPMGCSECHKSEKFSTLDSQICLDCHNQHDSVFGMQHSQDFGANCLDCHDGVDRMQAFNHQDTGYPLEFVHAQVTCTDCHKENSVASTPTECKDCHDEPSIHQGVFDSSCGSCHTPQGWSPANIEAKSFGHLRNANFSLALHSVDYQQQKITCITCHPNEITKADIQTCINCHTSNDQVFMGEHLTKFSSDCLSCHDGVDRLSNFDHANFFPLNGKHASIDCTDCHVNNSFRGTATECSQCHKEPELHTGVFGLRCDYCHNSEAWSPARLEQHTFPINHGLVDANMQLKCEACHGTTYSEYSCYSCHDHQQEEIRVKHLEEGITEQELPDCVKCHPNGQEIKGPDD